MLQKEDRVDVCDNDSLKGTFDRQLFYLKPTQPPKFRVCEARLFPGKLSFNREFGLALSVPAWKTINLYEADTYGPNDLLQHEETIPAKLLHFANKRWLMMIKEHGRMGETYWLMFPSTEEWVTCIRNASIYRGETSPQTGFFSGQGSRVLPSTPQLPPQPPQPPPRPADLCLIDIDSDRKEQNSYFTSPSIPMPEPQRSCDFCPPRTDAAQNRQNNVFLLPPPPPPPGGRSPHLPRSQSSQNNSNQGNVLRPIAVGLGTAVLSKVVAGLFEDAIESPLVNGVVNTNQVTVPKIYPNLFLDN